MESGRLIAAALAVGLLAACTASLPGSSRPSRPSSPGSLLAAVPVGSRPTAPAIGAGGVWVPNSGDGTVSRIDPTGNRVVATIKVANPQALLDKGCAPESVHSYYYGDPDQRDCDDPKAAAANQAAAWVTRNDDGSLVRIDPASNRVAAVIPIGIDGWDVAASRDSVWVTDYSTDTAVRVDPSTNAVVATLKDMDHGPVAIAITPDAVWVACSRPPYMLDRIDPATNQVVARIPVGKWPFGVAASGDAVWVNNQTEGTVSRVDPKTNQVVATIPVSPFEGRNGVDRIAATPDGAWISGFQIERIDSRSNAVASRLEHGAVALDAAGRDLWATDISGRVLHIRI